jgi:hypothetical protein
MARICTRCNRELNEQEHDVLRYPDDYKDEAKRGKVMKVPMVTNRGRGRIGIQMIRRYGCRVKLIATSPVTGKTLVPSHPQRLLAAGGARYVHESRFDNDLKP